MTELPKAEPAEEPVPPFDATEESARAAMRWHTQWAPDTPLTGALAHRPTRHEWEAILPPPEPVPHPVPEIPRRPAIWAEIPTGARRLARAAAANGWAVTNWYARGTAMGQRGAPGGLVESVALRMSRPLADGQMQRGVALYMRPLPGGGWTATAAYAWVGRDIPLPVGVTGLRQMLETASDIGQLPLSD